MASWLVNPWLLGAGAALIAAPIIIHLLNKRKFRIIDWAAMDFLLEADQRNRRLSKCLVQFVLNDAEPLLHHDEPIWRNGKMVGGLTSGNYGHFIGRATGLRYVKDADGVDAAYVEAQGFEIEIMGERCPAKASLRAPHDPKGERIRA